MFRKKSRTDITYADEKVVCIVMQTQTQTLPSMHVLRKPQPPIIRYESREVVVHIVWLLPVAKTKDLELVSNDSINHASIEESNGTTTTCIGIHQSAHQSSMVFALEYAVKLIINFTSVRKYTCTLPGLSQYLASSLRVAKCR